MAVEGKDLPVSATTVRLSGLRKRQDAGRLSGDEHPIRQCECLGDGVPPAVQSTGRRALKELAAKQVGEAKLPSGPMDLTDGATVIGRCESHEDLCLQGGSVNHRRRMP
jgi:hypothetical protein